MSQYNKDRPFFSQIKERYSLCKSGSKKSTEHIVLDLKGSGVTYQVGDSVAVLPINDTDAVTRTLHAMRATGEEIVTEKNTEKKWKLKDFLEKKANIATITKKLILELAHRQSNLSKKMQFDDLLREGHKQDLANYIEVRQVWDALLENPEATFTPQELCHLLLPLLPRFYSIASSMNTVQEEVHLTVASLEYVSNGHLRHGICTRFLLHTAPLNTPVVPIYIQHSHGFTLPESPDTPIIMIGPGTGVAPFRSFMQERVSQGSKGKNWLFFGEWNRAYNFFYEEYWQDLESQGKLRLDLAFSRDQEHKVYVQHRMLENATEFFRWLEEGAYLYVCGDAHRMAKDVEAILYQIIREQGHLDEDRTKQYVKKMRADKRYLRDIY